MAASLPIDAVVSESKKANPLAALGLPRYALLKSVSNSKYVRQTNEAVDKFLRACGEEAASPDCKFELEMAKTGRGLLNIRSCYTNKYWVQGSESQRYLKAKADLPNEDPSQWSCTLFEPVSYDHGSVAKTIQLRCVYTKKLVALAYGPDPVLTAYTDAKGDSTKFTVMDWESLVILPKRVAFKGDNGYYLRTEYYYNQIWLKFDMDDIGHPSVVNQITNAPDGCVRVKSEYSGLFWRRSPNWIWADSDDTSNNNKDTLFMPVRTSAGTNNNTVALRNLGNNCFCKRHNEDGWVNCLNAAVSSITREATLTVEEPVFSRAIFNVNFRLGDARIYDEKVVTMVTKVVFNYNTQPESQELELKYNETTSKTWDRSVSLKVGVATSIKAGVPFIAEGKIDISTEFEGSLSWSDTETTSKEITSKNVVTVSPMSKVKASVIATMGKCEVPFSYSQRDVLTNGETVIQEMDDGLYTGINSYNFHYETTTEPL